MRVRVHSFSSACVLAIIASTLSVYPHQLAYFNELAGGSDQGRQHLLGSNLDWGQDLLYFQEWLAARPTGERVHLAYHGGYDPAAIGFEDVLSFAQDGVNVLGQRPAAGCYVVSTNLLQGLPTQARDGGSANHSDVEPTLKACRSRTPVEVIGRSLLVYRF